jgi:flagellar L-ring protein precursor FlgH
MWRSDGLRVLALLLPLVVSVTGCVEVAVREARIPSDYSPLLLPPPPEPSPGAIWRGDRTSGSFLFYDRKARGVGDLVTVRVLENFSAVGSASTSLDKRSEIAAGLSSDIGLGQLVSQSAIWLLGKLGVTDAGVDAGPTDTVNVLEADNESRFEGDGETTREGRLTAIVTCRVLAQHPGGILHVRGQRTIVVNHELQLLTVEGLVRRDDIGIDNTVASTALAEARLTLDGVGVIDDKQRPPLFARLMDWLYPF